MTAAADHPVPAARRRELVVDDICSTGGTLVRVIVTVMAPHPVMVDIHVTHALHDDSVAAALKRAGARTIFSSDSVAYPSNAVFLAATLAEELRRQQLVRTPR